MPTTEACQFKVHGRCEGSCDCTCHKPKPVTDSTVRQIRRNLVEFGYTSLTLEDTRTAVQDVMAGKDPTGNIIGMMAKTMLVENGYLKGAPDA